MIRGMESRGIRRSRRSEYHRLRVGALALLVAAVSAWPSVAAAPAQHFLWRVRSQSTTVFLLGSVHFMKADAYPLARPIEGAFDRARVAVFEVDLDKLGGAAFKLLAAGTLPEDRTLRDVVSADTYADVSERVADMGLDVAAFRKMRPWLLAVTLSAFELTRAGYSPDSGIDRYFFDRAVERGIPTVALETVDEQVALFESLDPAEDEAFLRSTLHEIDEVIPMVDELLAAWRSGNVAEVEQLLGEAYSEAPELMERLVTARNRRWLPRIEELLAGSEEAMVVVGALHLVGENGLVALLGERGYSVEQL
jgi:uncharacterized protein YbaP (TraB family)